MYRRRVATLLALTLCIAAGATMPAAAGAAQRPDGAAKPTPGSGIGTRAALENPRCRTAPEYMPYGRFDAALVGQGPVCVKPWTASDDNGGVTAPGVTADAITVVTVVPNPTQPNPVTAFDRATKTKSTWQNAVHDLLLPMVQYYETWGRALDVRFVESSGSDEAAQRADAVKIRELKPFAMINVVSSGLDVLDAELAKSKILVYGYATTNKKAQAQAPYRWGHSDTQANVTNAAEVIGKQLAGKKAKFGGGDVRTKARRFGMIAIEDIIDTDLFASSLRKWGDVTLAAKGSYTATGATTGDPASAQQQAPVLVQRLKDAGVTTVILVTDAAMARSAMTAASSQEYFPEWFFTGALFADIALLARSYPQEQMAHAFGNMTASPWVADSANPTGDNRFVGDTDGPVNWYFGQGAGSTASPTSLALNWLMRGVHAAGPNLTPKTFTQGLFSTPARLGAADDAPVGAMQAFGGTAGLPYDEYLATGADFTAFWWDPELTGPGAGTGTEGKGNARFLKGAKRYLGGTVPTKPFGYFSEKGTITSFDTYPVPSPGYAGDCTGCATSGGTAAPGAPDPERFVIDYFEATPTRTKQGS